MTCYDVQLFIDSKLMQWDMTLFRTMTLCLTLCITLYMPHCIPLYFPLGHQQQRRQEVQRCPRHTSAAEWWWHLAGEWWLEVGAPLNFGTLLYLISSQMLLFITYIIICDLLLDKLKLLESLWKYIIIESTKNPECVDFWLAPLFWEFAPTTSAGEWCAGDGIWRMSDEALAMTSGGWVMTCG